MMEKTLPTQGEKEEAARAIERWIVDGVDPDAAADTIRSILNGFVPGIEEAYAQRKAGGKSAVLPYGALPRFLVDMMGVEILEGDHGRRVREQLLRGMMRQRPKKIAFLARQIRPDLKEIGTEDAFKMLINPNTTRWRPGGAFAQRFTYMFRIPPVFAGMAPGPPPDRVEEVYPRTEYHELKKFQENMKNQILGMLGNKGSKRAIVVLPTGAGKTKTVVEAVTEFWKSRPDGVRSVLWIAQTNELCEQAISCFRQIWEEKGTDGTPLRIFRSWKGRSLPHPNENGIIVAGIAQLNRLASKTGGEDTDLSRLGEHLGAVFIDEAHRSWAPEYRRVLTELGIRRSPGSHDIIPLIGLTATPERTASGETEKLHRFYGKRIIYPSMEYEPRADENGDLFDQSWSSVNEVREKLTEYGYLARPKYAYEDLGKEFNMTDKETAHYERLHSFDDSLLRRMGTDFDRNTVTYRVLKGWAAKGRKVLFFGANVAQALLMARFLEDDGIRSATITGTTRYNARRAHVGMFQDGDIRVLCNYDVLTTGFDAPKVDTIVIARPTSSRIVYQQMIGRGLRGPKFGGTESCDIITIADTVKTNTREQIDLGYAQYKRDMDL